MKGNFEEKLSIFFLSEDCIFPSEAHFQKVAGNPSLPLPIPLIKIS